MNKQQTPSLPVHEWLAIATIIVFFLFIVFLSQIYQKKDFTDSIPLDNAIVNVSIEGAVEKPGSYFFPKGTVLEKVIDQVGLKENADVKGLKLKSKILNDQRIVVKTIPLITVYVEGAAENKGKFTVPKGATLKKILQMVSPHENANLKLLGSQNRKLISEEIIRIPEK